MKHVALLRGINVGGNRKVRMEDLRRVVEKAGGKNVVTYIQSGNVVFDHASRSASALTTTLTTAIETAFKFTGFSLVLRTGGELAKVLDDNPFAGEPDDHLHVMFLDARVARDKLAGVDIASGRDRFDVRGRELYLCLPDGMGRSKLAAALSRHKALTTATARNFRTVRALLELTAKD